MIILFLSSEICFAYILTVTLYKLYLYYIEIPVNQDKSAASLNHKAEEWLLDMFRTFNL
jgi:hypothetical protein